MRLFLVATCLLFLSTPILAVEDDADLGAQVKKLVRQLDASSRDDRESAEKSLVALGPDALAHFPRITNRTPAEVRDRLSRIRKQLEVRMAEAAAQPALVTLKGEMPLADAFQALEQQTGNRTTGFDRRSGTVDVKFEEAPYWEVLDKLLDESDLTINAYGGETGALVIQSRAPQMAPRFGRATYSGVFRFEPVRLEARRDLRNSSVDGLRLTVSVSWEPRVRPISLQQTLAKIEATDDRGESLTIDESRAAGNRGSLTASAENGISEIELGIPISLPERESKTISSLQGELTALVPGSVETFEFEDFGESRDVELQKAGVTVTFERMRRNVNLYELRMNVRFDEAADALESHRGWVFGNESYVVDADGQKVDNVGFQATRQNPDEVGVAYLFALPDGPRGCKFVYKTPATIMRLPVTWEIKDIDLP